MASSTIVFFAAYAVFAVSSRLISFLYLTPFLFFYFLLFLPENAG